MIRIVNLMLCIICGFGLYTFFDGMFLFSRATGAIGRAYGKKVSFAGVAMIVASVLLIYYVQTFCA